MSITTRITAVTTVLVAGCCLGAAGSVAGASGGGADPELFGTTTTTLHFGPAPKQPIISLPTIKFVTTTTKLQIPIKTLPTIKVTPTSIHIPIKTLPSFNLPTTVAPPADTEPAPPATEAPSTPSATVPRFDSGSEPLCAYRASLVVATSDLTARAADLALRPPSAADVSNLDDTALTAMHAAHLFPYVITDGTDPLQLVARLGAEGIVAAPVSLVLPAGEWGFSAANPPVDLSTPAPDVPGGLSSPKQIAELDTGFSAAAGDPTWMRTRVKAASGLDEDATSPATNGHGKFVASLIAQERPDVQITVGAAAPVDLDAFVGDGKRPAPSVVTDASDELQLWLGMRRLLATSIQFDALALPIGAYACPLSTSGLVTQAALIDWYAATGGKPVAAAVGNHVPGEPGPYPAFLPAGMGRQFGTVFQPAFESSLCAAPVTCVPGRLYDVRSVDADGQPSAFSNDGHVAAPGEQLVGIRLGTAQATMWSGTSFATAIVAAAIADGSQPGDGSVIVAQHVVAGQVTVN